MSQRSPNNSCPSRLEGLSAAQGVTPVTSQACLWGEGGLSHIYCVSSGSWRLLLWGGPISNPLALCSTQRRPHSLDDKYPGKEPAPSSVLGQKSALLASWGLAWLGPQSGHTDAIFAILPRMFKC